MTEMNKLGSGTYNRALQRLVRSATQDQYGAYSWTYADDTVYWANVQQTQSVETDTLGRTVTITRAKLKIRNWVTLSVLDRLTDLQWNETYIIDSIARGNDEVIVEAHHQ